MNARYDEVHEYICSLVKEIERPPQGLFQYPSLATATGDTYNCGIFCWDSHHMSLRLAAVGHPEYMKYFLLTILKFQYSNGFVPSYCTPENGGGNLTDFHAQPYLAQNAAIYYSLTGDVDTLRQIYGKLELYLDYRRSISSSASGLYRWTAQWMSGFDNEVAGTFYPPDTVITPDLPALLYLEFRAMEYLARNLGKDPARYHELAEEVRAAVNELLWNDEYGTYAAYSLTTGKTIPGRGPKENPDGFGYAYISCPSLLVLFAGIASQERAERMIRGYVLSPEHFRSRFGIRSLSRRSPYYNNARIGNPPRYGDPHRMTNSNWQGPVWIPLNWFVFHALLRYGFRNEAEQLADDTVGLIGKSLDTLGSMRESYDAETGMGTYADHFASWNILTDIMPLFCSGKEPLSLFPWETEK